MTMVVVTETLFQLVIFLGVIVGLSEVTTMLEARDEEPGFVLLIFCFTQILAKWQEHQQETGEVGG